MKNLKNLECCICAKTTPHFIYTKCICNQDVGDGYTYSDEFGDCPVCLGLPARCTKCNSIRSLTNVQDNDIVLGTLVKTKRDSYTVKNITNGEEVVLWKDGKEICINIKSIFKSEYGFCTIEV